MKLALRARYAALIFAALALCIVVSSALFATQMRHASGVAHNASAQILATALNDAAKQDAQAISARLADGLSAPLNASNSQKMSDLLRAVRSNAGVLMAQVFDANGRLIHDGDVFYDQDGPRIATRDTLNAIQRGDSDAYVTARENSLFVAQSIRVDGVVIGGLQLRLSLRDIQAQTAAAQATLALNTNAMALEARKTLIVSTGIIITFALLVAFGLATYMAAPIRALAAEAKGVAVGKPGAREDSAAQDDIALLRTTLHSLGVALQSNYDALLLEKDKAEASDRAKADFLATMSHEMRTPLNAVIGYCELLEDELQDAMTDDAQSDLTSIGLAAKHLVGLIDDVLDYSKADSGHLEYFIASCSLERMFEKTLRIWSAQAQENGNTLRWAADGDFHVLADEARLRQALGKIVDNACKFTQDGAINIRARAVADANAPAIAIDISDTGTGMSQPSLSALFKPFSQVDSSMSRKHDGAGLSLALVKRFIEGMGGRIEVKSVLGDGSTFTVLLPAAKPEAHRLDLRKAS
ncbi:MAG: ATP-binding protein [Pseudomonadota bacterium]